LVVERIAGAVDGIATLQDEIVEVGAEREADRTLHRIVAAALVVRQGLRDLVLGAVDDIEVVAGPAGHAVVAGIAVQRIVALAADQLVVAGIAGQVVGVVVSSDDVCGRVADALLGARKKSQVFDIGSERERRGGAPHGVHAADIADAALGDDIARDSGVVGIVDAAA